MVDDLKQKVIDLIEPALTSEGCELADIAVSRYRTAVTVRLFVYTVGGSPTVAQCSHLAHVVGEVIDGTDLFEKGYTLEVSSPGLDRPLTTIRDFKYRIGETVKIEFADRKRKKETAEITAVTEDAVEFRSGDGLFSVPVRDIERARIVF